MTTETMPDLYELLPRCNGRLTIPDATALYESADECRPQRILEIGAANGCSTVLLGTVARKYDGHLFSIEPHHRAYGNLEYYALSQYVTMINGFSPWVRVPLDGLVDYLFIDGDHRLRWVIVDYHYWEKFVRPGGYIAFHDYGANNKRWGAWVEKAVALILENDPMEEVSHSPATNKNPGLIVFRKPEEKK